MKAARKVRGVGINDADYVVQVRETLGYVDGKQKQRIVWECPYYSTWTRMLDRCYSKTFHKHRPSYIGCSVCKEWHIFSNFKAWMETQDYEGLQLDKDLLIRGNRVYSPESCCFISLQVNSFLLEGSTRRGAYKIGCYLDKRRNKFHASCTNPFKGPGVKEFLGYFSSEDEAHKAWLVKKLELAKLLAHDLDEKLASALVKRYENYSEVK